MLKPGTNKWIGVDLDGTLAMYGEWQGYLHIGEPIPEMVKRVQEWLDAGIEVRIFTARLDGGGAHAAQIIKLWCKQHIGQMLEVTNVKTAGMIELWDDRAVRVERNTGKRVL